VKNQKINKWFKIIGIPVIVALAIRGFFGIEAWNDLFSVMTVGFLFFGPLLVGMLTTYLSDVKKLENRWYVFFLPWIPIFLFFLITLAFKIEGWACWLMVLPFYLLAASVGGIIGSEFKKQKVAKRQNLSVYLVALLPFLISPIEKMIGAIPGTYDAYTFIDIEADKTEIWNNVTQVSQIQKEQDKGWFTEFLGFPRPLKAELNFEGVGASREAIFDKGLVFHEEVKEYEHQKKMRFSIKANPHEIPSTTMDQHVVIGGDYFDVLDGTYELEKLNKSTYRLHLYSHFTLNTTFNFYASWWARWIMQDIQNNILQVVKQRAEKA
jgi:hypothetical protein